MALTKEILDYIEASKEETLALLKDLCLIPAPSGMEEKRAEFCKNWFIEQGGEGVYIDEALNVVCPINCEGKDQITVFMAHTDTVFPDTEPMPYYVEGTTAYCPGIGDDTASLVVLMMAAKYFLNNKLSPKDGLLIVANSCEEGLGNLVGVRQLMKDYSGRVKQFITLDEDIGFCVNGAVGSHRYKVEAATEGGHSFSDFGKKNAIAALADIIADIYKIKVPEKKGATTTYNVGIISGGTSINTIAQSAEMLCEYRSDDRECLAIMRSEFERVFEGAKSDEVCLKVTLLGDRPCKGEVDAATEESLISAYRKAVSEVTGKEISLVPASTDANVPMSLGIAAVDMGVFRNGGTHTREEWLDKSCVVDGLDILIRVINTLIDGQRGDMI